MREDLEELQAQHPGRFKLWFTLDHPPEGTLPILGNPESASHLCPSGFSGANHTPKSECRSTVVPGPLPPVPATGGKGGRNGCAAEGSLTAAAATPPFSRALLGPPHLTARHPRASMHLECQFSPLRSTSGWAYSTGFVTADMIREHLPAPGDDVLLLLCGPPPMVQLACHPNLDKLGYSQKMRFTY